MKSLICPALASGDFKYLPLGLRYSLLQVVADVTCDMDTLDAILGVVSYCPVNKNEFEHTSYTVRK